MLRRKFGFRLGKRGQTQHWFADFPIGIGCIILGFILLTIFSGNYEEDTDIKIAKDINENLVRTEALTMLRTEIELEGIPEQYKGINLAELISHISKNYYGFDEQFNWMLESGILNERNDDYKTIKCGADFYILFQKQLEHGWIAVYSRAWLADTNQKPLFECGGVRGIVGAKVNITIPTDVAHNYLIVEYMQG